MRFSRRFAPQNDVIAFVFRRSHIRFQNKSAFVFRTIRRSQILLLNDVDVIARSVSDVAIYAFASFFAAFLAARRSCHVAIEAYTVGIITSVTSVEIESPHATTIPSERHISEPSP